MNSLKILALLLILVATSVKRAEAATDAVLPTPLEAHAQAQISNSAEMSVYLHALAATQPSLARVEVLGDSVQGRPLEVLRLAAPRGKDKSPRAKVMVIGSQHGAAEPAGGEALLVIARELLSGSLRPLLDDLEIILLPNANPDGRDLKRRANANWININTDFVLLSQPESQLLKEAVSRYAPDALLDSHESAILKRKTLAKDGYLTDFDAQFEIANNPAVPAAVRDYALQTFLPTILERVSAGGLPAHRYIGEIISIKQPITNGGLTLRNFRNTAGMSGGLSLLVETKLDSREDSFPTYRNIAARVERQLLCIRTFLGLVHERRNEILRLTTAARQALHKEPLTLFAGYAVDRAHPQVEIPLRRLNTRKLETLKFRDHRTLVTADTEPFPPMLVVTQHLDKLRPILERHQVNFWSVTQPTSAEVIATRFKGPGNILDRAELLQETRKSLAIEAGGIFIDLTQPNGRTAALLLDPRSTSSVFRYPEFSTLVVPTQEFFVYRTFKGATRSPP